MAANDIYGLKKNQDGSFTEAEIRATLNVQTSTIMVDAIGTAAENGTTLNAAYTAAKAMTPYGAALSATNRVRIVVAPGKYTLALAVNTQFIDFVSLDGNRSILLSEINVTASDVYLKGIDMGTAAFTVATALPALICENCKGGSSSFGYNTGSGGTFSGTVINCQGGSNSFGSGSGQGASGGIFSGTAINCIGGDDSFGVNTFSGTATNCTGSSNNFGYTTFSGTATNCTAGNGSFGCTTFSGTATNCTAGNGSFGYTTFSGTATNCTAGNGSFGGDLAGFGTITLTARLYYCRKTAGTFETPDTGGRQILCIDGSNTVVTV